MSEIPLPHIDVSGRQQTERYTSPQQARSKPPPAHDRARHGQALLAQLGTARRQKEARRGVTTAPDEPARITLEIRSEPEFELALESLEPRRQEWELACVRMDGDVRVAVIYVPAGRLSHFVRLLDQYLNEDTDTGRPKNQNLVERIAAIRLAGLREFWTDASTHFPDDDESIWWEVWLRSSNDQGPLDRFRTLATSAGLRVGTDTIRFPDRVVGLCFGTAQQFGSQPELIDMLAEVRRAKENPADFALMPAREQADWVNDLP